MGLSGNVVYRYTLKKDVMNHGVAGGTLFSDKPIS